MSRYWTNKMNDTHRIGWRILLVVCLMALPGCTTSEFHTDGKTSREELLRRRDQAVIRGLRWIARELEPDSNLKETGSDAVSLFLENEATATNPEIKKFAGETANKLAARLVNMFQKHTVPLHGYDFTDYLEFISRKDQLNVDLSSMVRRARDSYQRYETADDLYGTRTSSLESATEDRIYDLMMSAFCVERGNLVYENQFKVEFRLEHIFEYIWSRPFESHSGSSPALAEDHYYLATHIAFILNDYSRLPLCEDDVPWLYEYLRQDFDYLIHTNDIELVGEFVDIFRNLGYTEFNDTMVRKGTEFLLDTQNPDGSWGQFEEDDDAYDRIHYTWCACGGLRVRTLQNGTKYHAFIKKLLPKLKDIRPGTLLDIN